ncbi:DUF6164 family protein, partial [Stenotrophomonas sp. SrG]
MLNLRNVADDEIQEVITLLDRAGNDHYRTEPSPWGISLGGIWIRDD